MTGQRWRGWENAEIYDRFVRDWPIYRWLNEQLAERAALEQARRVLDLGCGTGASTHACLRRLRPDAEIVGIDASPEMVEVARAQTLDPRARFVVVEGARVHESVEGPFDRAISNAAFWQLAPPAEMLRALARVLAPGALLVFNIPTERIEGRHCPPHPFQLALARALEAHTQEPFARTATLFDVRALDEVARATGFSPAHEEVLTYEGVQAEFIDLMSIPAMIAPLTRGFTPEEVEKVLEPVRASVEPNERVRVDWSFLSLRFLG